MMKKILDNLTHHQLVGLKYYYDLRLYIPRTYIRKNLEKNSNVLII